MYGMLKVAVGNETVMFKWCQHVKSCEGFWEGDIVQVAHLYHW
jgi:hypothetical protein